MKFGSVLHVTESFGGGVATAIQAYVKATPEFEHHLLRSTRSGDVDPADEAKYGRLFASVQDLPRNPLHARQSIRATRNFIRPNVIHAHSSFAGAFVRTSVKNNVNLPIIYTPHGFSFERQDINSISRLVFRLLEVLFSYNTDTIAGCSEREANLASGWNARRQPVLLPNQSDNASDLANSVEFPMPYDASRIIAGGGRLTAAKGANLFADVVDMLNDHGAGFTAMWIGGGDAVDEQALREHDVHVTGWQPRAKSLKALKQADVYLHTSRWEGFPYAVLEAKNLGLPIVVRDIPAFSGVPDNVKGRSAEDLSILLHAVLTDDYVKQQNIATWQKFLRHNTESVQAEILRRLYNRPEIN